MSHPASTFRIIPINGAFVQRARSGFDDQAQPVERLVAKGGEPLRDALRRAQPGEEILLASHSPFNVAGPFREFGAVFLSAHEQPLPPLDRLPTEGEQPYLGSMFVLRAYSDKERIVDAALTSPANAQEHIDSFFARPDVAFVHARFPTYGCYALRLERA